MESGKERTDLCSDGVLFVFRTVSVQSASATAVYIYLGVNHALRKVPSARRAIKQLREEIDGQKSLARKRSFMFSVTRYPLNVALRSLRHHVIKGGRLVSFIVRSVSKELLASRSFTCSFIRQKCTEFCSQSQTHFTLLRLSLRSFATSSHLTLDFTPDTLCLTSQLLAHRVHHRVDVAKRREDREKRQLQERVFPLIRWSWTKKHLSSPTICAYAFIFFSTFAETNGGHNVREH